VIPDRAQFRGAPRFAAAVASEFAAPLLRAYASARARGPATTPQEWRRGLILGSGHIGDVLYRTCSLEQLARGLPDCRWSYLTTSEGAEILKGNPAIWEVLPLNRTAAIDFVQPHSSDDLRACNFDVALCTDSIKPYQALSLAAKVGISNRVAFVQKGFSGLATIGIRASRASWPAQIRTMVNAVIGTTETSELRPRVYLTDDDRREARREWESVAHGGAALTIAASVISRQELGVFPASLFEAVLRSVLEQRPDARIVLTGSSGDESRLRAIASALGVRAVVRAGTVSLRGFAGFLALCDAFVGADSGPRHVANAVGIPAYFVRNLAVPEIEAGRYCDTEIDVAPPGQYLSNSAALRRLEAVDHRAVATAIITAAIRHNMNSRHG